MTATDKRAHEVAEALKVLYEKRQTQHQVAQATKRFDFLVGRKPENG